MGDPVSKIKTFQEEEYQAFILDFQSNYAASPGYIPMGIEGLITLHGRAIYRAYLTQSHLKKQGVASFFTAQRMEAILFQIVMKSLFEIKFGDVGKHHKIARNTQQDTTDIRKLMANPKENSDYWLSISSNIFDFSHGESWSFFLGGGDSQFIPKNMFLILKNSLLAKPYSLSPMLADEIVNNVETIWLEYKSKLPKSILELAVIPNEDNYQSKICFSESFAKNLRTPKSYEELLTANEQKVQARVLAPNPNNPGRVAIMRFNPDSTTDALNKLKEQVAEVIKSSIEKDHERILQEELSKKTNDLQSKIQYHVRILSLLGVNPGLQSNNFNSCTSLQELQLKFTEIESQLKTQYVLGLTNYISNIVNQNRSTHTEEKVLQSFKNEYLEKVNENPANLDSLDSIYKELVNINERLQSNRTKVIFTIIQHHIEQENKFIGRFMHKTGRQIADAFNQVPVQYWDKIGLSSQQLHEKNVPPNIIKSIVKVQKLVATKRYGFNAGAEVQTDINGSIIGDTSTSWKKLLKETKEELNNYNDPILSQKNQH